MKDGLHIDNDGWNYWYKDGDFHRDNDLPAFVDGHGTKYWYQSGFLHRYNDKPAIEGSDGYKQWFKHGEIHRVGGYASYFINGYGVLELGFLLEGIKHTEKGYWKGVGKQYGLIIRNKTKI